MNEAIWERSTRRPMHAAECVCEVQSALEKEERMEGRK